MKKRHLVAINLINLLVITSLVDCIQLDNELVSKPQRKCKLKLTLKVEKMKNRKRDPEIEFICWSSLMKCSRVGNQFSGLLFLFIEETMSSI